MKVIRAFLAIALFVVVSFFIGYSGVACVPEADFSDPIGKPYNPGIGIDY